MPFLTRICDQDKTILNNTWYSGAYGRRRRNYAFVYISTSATSRGTLIGTANTWNPASAIAATTLFGGMTYYINVETINGDPGQSYSPARSSAISRSPAAGPSRTPPRDC
jgi:hypothetical protein